MRKNLKVCPLTMIRLISVFILSLVILTMFIRKNNKQCNEHFNETQTQPIPQVQILQPVIPVTQYNFKPVSKEEFTERVSLSDFFTSLNSSDMIARSTTNSPITSEEHYKNVYISSYEDFTEIEKNILNKVVEEANKLLTSYQNLQQLEWKFVKVNSKIENGLPHTISDMIVVNTDLLKRTEKELIKTIIHEKVHVYQRLNALSSRNWITQTDFLPLSSSDFMSLNKDVLDMRRSNPDLDRNTYYHKKSKLVIKQLYNSTSPQSIMDSKAYGIPLTGGYSPIPLTNELLGLPKSVYCQLEHPYEIMACIIADILTNPTYLDEYGKNDFVNTTIKWMNQELKA
jgi:hypothetical protein